jgi:hypothetical protein
MDGSCLFNVALQSVQEIYKGLVQRNEMGKVISYDLPEGSETRPRNDQLLLGAPAAEQMRCGACIECHQSILCEHLLTTVTAPEAHFSECRKTDPGRRGEDRENKQRHINTLYHCTQHAECHKKRK